MALRTTLLLSLVLATLAAPARAGSALEEREREIVALAAKLRPSVVKVHAISDGDAGIDRKVIVSGVVLDTRGTIATVGSAVTGAREVLVETIDGALRKATVLGVDERTNVGILATDPSGLVPVEPAPSAEVRVGRFAMVVGNPFGLTGTVGTGIVSGIGREVQGTGLKDGKRVSVLFYDLVQTSAPVNPGDSGGLLADSKGRMIGMVSSTFGRSPSMERIRDMIRELARSVDLDRVEAFLPALKLTDEQQALARLFLDRFRGYQEKVREKDRKAGSVVFEGMPEGIPGAAMGAQGINFALPAAQVVYAARMIRAHGRMIRLGIKAELPEPALVAHRSLRPGEGLLVRSVAEGSPAAAAGIGRFDILLELAGRPMGRLRDLRRALVASPVTGAISATVLLPDGSRARREIRFR